MRVFEEKSKTQNPKLIHPSDKQYTKTLKKREKIAKSEGRFINPLFFYARITRIRSFTIRAVQNAIFSEKPLTSLMSILASRMVSG